jgi:hypothetical protein
LRCDRAGRSPQQHRIFRVVGAGDLERNKGAVRDAHPAAVAPVQALRLGADGGLDRAQWFARAFHADFPACVTGRRWRRNPRRHGHCGVLGREKHRGMDQHHGRSVDEAF